MTTQRSQARAEHPRETFGTEQGRHFPYSEPGDWVALASIPHGPKALYYVYCGHINKKKNGWTCWPLQEDLANILGATEKTIRKWNDVLEKIGAIEVTEVIDPSTGYKRLVVEVHQTAPEGYDGFIDYTSYYRAKRETKRALESTLAEAAADQAPRQPRVKSTPGLPEKSTGGPDQAKEGPPVNSSGGQGAESTPGQGAESTDKETQDKKRKGRTHTPPADEQPTQIDRDAIFDALDRCLSPSPEAKNIDVHGVDALITLVRSCLAVGVQLPAIEQALAEKIDSKTTEPYGWARKILIMLHDQAASPEEYPLGKGVPAQPNATRSLWLWPPLKAHDRPCRGRSCNDRYVPLETPGGQQFSCPDCRVGFEADEKYIAMLARHKGLVAAEQ